MLTRLPADSVIVHAPEADFAMTALQIQKKNIRPGLSQDDPGRKHFLTPLVAIVVQHPRRSGAASHGRRDVVIERYKKEAALHAPENTARCCVC